MADARFTLGTNQFDELGFGKWQLGRLTYDFQPIPEPSALLLLGSGLGALAFTRRLVRQYPVGEDGEAVFKSLIGIEQPK